MIPALLPLHIRADVSFERGEGPYLYDAAGRRYLDFICGIGVTGLGHCHPHLVEALVRQGGKVWHVSNLFENPLQTRLAERLVAASFADTAFFFNSGVEAIECSLKMARKYHDAVGRPERYRIITFEGAFHGRTLAAIAAGGQAKHLAGFDPPVDGFDQVPFGDLEAVRRAITGETGGILIEPVQGEGGIRPARPEFLRGLRETADEIGLLLIFDEVQCGMGRTGRLFAHEWAGVAPDIVAIAKALGGGFPVGACLAREAAASGMTVGSHGTTFGGNPLAMAVANAVLDVVLAEGFFARIESIAARLREGLEGLAKAYPMVVEEVRGLGLMLGMKCRPPNRELVSALRGKGLLAGPAGENVVRFLPPLIVEEPHVDEALGIIAAVLKEVAS